MYYKGRNNALHCCNPMRSCKVIIQELSIMGPFSQVLNKEKMFQKTMCNILFS